MSKVRASAALVVLAGLALTACGSPAKPAAAFTPEGGTGTTPSASSVPSGSGTVGKVVMPPFGSNAHIDMTGWLPANQDQAAAVVTDKDYELAVLYAYYTSGKDKSWQRYVDQNISVQVAAQLEQPDVTTQSFTGTIRYFDMRVIPDPNVSGDLDVSACFDNAQAPNTSASTGKVLPDTTPADQHYWRYTDQLALLPSGTWQVVGAFPAVYYPREKECKP